MSTDVIVNPTELHDAYVFDMDGTIYLGDHLLPGAARMINELRRRGIPVRFLSNNPTKDPDQYVAKLEKLGVSREVVGLVMPSGMSFNTDGTAIYMTMGLMSGWLVKRTGKLAPSILLHVLINALASFVIRH